MIGVLGAGQLGRMLALAGYPLGLEFLFIDPTAHSPAGQLAPQLVTSYDDPKALDELVQRCDVVTYEFENVPETAAAPLEHRVALYPGVKALTTSQDRWVEKSCFARLGIATPPFAAVSTEAELMSAIERIGVPSILKTRRGGYDGKGQKQLKSASEAQHAFEELNRVPCILEGFVPFEREVSLLAVRSARGECAFYPLVENHHSEGILRLTLAPAPSLSPELTALAEDYGRRLLEDLDYVGVLTLELFQIGNTLIANEFAPRVHNSGHFSIEGARTSQFENHLRAITGLPLGSTELLGYSAMLNLVGAIPSREAVLSASAAKLHLYGKSPRPGRKLGHITVNAETAIERDAQVALLLPRLVSIGAYPASRTG